MGDLSSSDCSWKKMVIAKANNKWISTMKLDYNDMENTLNVTEIDAEPRQVDLEIKIEKDESSVDQSNEVEMPMSITQEVDPLDLLHSEKPKRRRSSNTTKCESPEDRAFRLAKMSAYAANRLANETPEQRATRLKRMSEYAAKRLAHETSDQRSKRLSRMSAYAAKRLANETPDQRQARLARMSAYAARRQAMKKVLDSSESPESSQA